MSSAIPPQADGDAIDVPFMSIRRWRVHVGTGATAAPGALIQTPRSPSAVGPRLDLQIESNCDETGNKVTSFSVRNSCSKLTKKS